MSPVHEKNHTLKNKIVGKSVKSIFSEHEVKITLFSLIEHLVIVAIELLIRKLIM